MDPLVLYVKNIIIPLVDKPDEIHITKTIDSQGTLLTVKTAPEDAGIVIGFEGRTAMSIRQILSVLGFVRGHEKIQFKIVNPRETHYISERERYPRDIEPIIE